MSINDIGNAEFVAAVNELKNAEHFFAVYRQPAGKVICLYSGTGQTTLDLLIQAFHRNIEVNRLAKLAFLNIDHLRVGDVHNDNFNLSPIGYLNLKNMCATVPPYKSESFVELGFRANR